MILDFICRGRSAGKTTYILNYMQSSEMKCYYVSSHNAELKRIKHIKPSIDVYHFNRLQERGIQLRDCIMCFDECYPNSDLIEYLESRNIHCVVALTPTAELGKDKHLMRYLVKVFPEEFI